MPRYRISCDAEFPTVQRAITVRDWLKNNIPADIRVIAWDASRVDRLWTVIAVDTNTRDVTTHTLTAVDEAAAKALVENATTIVSEVRPARTSVG